MHDSQQQLEELTKRLEEVSEYNWDKLIHKGSEYENAFGGAGLVTGGHDEWGFWGTPVSQVCVLAVENLSSALAP